MSNDNKEQEQTNKEVNATVEQSGQDQEIDVNALMEMVENLKNTNERLLNESKKYKSGLQSLKNEIVEKEKAQFETDGNLEKLLEIEKNKSFELEERLRKNQENVLRQKLNFEVAKYAKNAFDVDDVIKALPKDLIEIDKENLEIRGIKDAVEAVKKSKSYLFDNGVRPHGMGQEPPAEYRKESKEQTLDDLLAQGFQQGII